MSKNNLNLLNLEKFLPYRLSVVTNKISNALANLYSEKFDLTINEWRIMAVLGQYPCLSADEVCIKTEMDKVGVSRAVIKLLKKKYIKRKFFEKDRRRSILELSKSGYRVYDRIVPIAHEFERQLIQSLSRKDLKNLDTVLDHLNNSMPDHKL